MQLTFVDHLLQSSNVDHLAALHDLDVLVRVVLPRSDEIGLVLRPAEQ